LLLDKKSLKPVEIAEGYADGLVNKKKFHRWAWRRDLPGGVAALCKAWEAAESAAYYGAEVTAQTVANTDAEKARSWKVAFQAAWAIGTSIREAIREADANVPGREAARKSEQEAQADLLHDIFGPLPFRKVNIDPAWLAWNNGTVKRLAEAAYADRTMPAGTLDVALMGVLADALEESGCTSEEILEHLRGPGPHVRGCFVLDLLLGKD